MFKVILFLNNFYKCLQYSGETKDFCEEKIESEDTKKRIDNIFLNELNKGKKNLGLHFERKSKFSRECSYKPTSEISI